MTKSTQIVLELKDEKIRSIVDYTLEGLVQYFLERNIVVRGEYLDFTQHAIQRNVK